MSCLPKEEGVVKTNISGGTLPEPALGLSPAPVSVEGVDLGFLSLSSLSPAMVDVVVELWVTQTCALEGVRSVIGLPV